MENKKIIPDGYRGILMLPLQANILKPNNKDWKLTKCPECGALCWEGDLHRDILKKQPELKALCTYCALKYSQEER